MYWLRWHYHVKDIAGAPYIIKKKRKANKTTESPTVSSRGRQQLYCAVQSRSPSHCQTTTGKVQSSAHDGTSSSTVHSWQTTAGCSTHVPKPLWRHGHRVLNVWWTVHQHGWVSRAQTTSVDVRCPVQAPTSKVRRRCSMKTAVGQNAQPGCDSLRNSQPMEFTKQWVMQGLCSMGLWGYVVVQIVIQTTNNMKLHTLYQLALLSMTFSDLKG